MFWSFLAALLVAGFLASCIGVILALFEEWFT
jgi:hypothetical protein